MIHKHFPDVIIRGSPKQEVVASLDTLLVMQDDLRHWDQLGSMIDHVVDGGFWTPEYLVEYAQKNNFKTSPIIQISKFEDHRFFIHDGHHRCVATYLGGRNYLREDEYQIKEWKYEQYLEINHPKGWYTPFDPRIHIRTADFGTFKEEAKKFFLTDPTKAEQWVKDNVSVFRRDRTLEFVPELANDINSRFF